MDRKQRRRVVAIMLAFASAVALIVGAFGDKWMIDNQHEDALAIGLRDTYLCDEGKCATMSNSEAVAYLDAKIERLREENAKLPDYRWFWVPPDPWRGFPAVGWIAFVTALISAAALLTTASIAVAGKRIDWPVMPTTIGVLALALTIINGALVVAMKPALTHFITVGWTFITFGGGAVAGLAAVFPLNRQIRPIDPELGAAAATVSWSVSRDEV
jgi:hypothetical protein